MVASELLKFTTEGIYCPAGDFWIDPNRKKSVAIITHAHSDHAVRGHGKYICHTDSASLLKLFFGENIKTLALQYGESIDVNGVKITLFPSGHILGASQVLLEYNGVRAVVAGDYKVENDGITPAFEPVKCDIFVTESTFAKPQYEWEPQEIVFADINAWWRNNLQFGFTSILQTYSLGKSQRILGNIDSSIGKVCISEQVSAINEIYRSAGKVLPQSEVIHPDTSIGKIEGSLIVVSSPKAYECIQKLVKKDIQRVSGWVLDTMFGMGGFALSDHADWKGLLTAIEKTGAKQVYVQHGFTSQFTKHLRSIGYDAYDVEALKKKSGEVELF
jgi:putative mRNA 3-end processing factor